MVDGGGGGFAHLGFGVVSHAEAHRVHHGQVVGAVANHQHFAGIAAQVVAEGEHGLFLGFAVDDVADECAVERLAPHAQHIGGNAIEA